MKKLSNSEAELKKSVAYKKKHLPSYKNIKRYINPLNLLSKSIDWFLYEGNTGT